MNDVFMGISTNYLIAGENNSENILLLHGWGANVTLFDPIISHLSKTLRVIALDLPGFGHSAEPPYAWGVDDYVQFIHAFLAQLNITKAMLLGHSFGGRIIIKLISNTSLLVPKIILTGSAGVLPDRKLTLKSRFYKAGKALYNLGIMKKLFPDALDNLRYHFGSVDYKDASPIMRLCLIKVVNEDLQPLFHLNTAETLLVWGENDTDTPLNDGKIMERLMPNAGLAIIKNAGHFAYLQQSGTFNKILNSFLNIKEV